MDKIIEGRTDELVQAESFKAKNVGLYFGSFNPIHVGHLILANHLLNEQLVDEVWFIVSPQNPLKEKKNLLAEHHRLAMVRAAIEANPKLKASDVEFGLPKPSYTSYTLAVLVEKYPQYCFSLLMGEDNLRNFHKWKNYEFMLDKYRLIVYPRAKTIQEAITDENETNDIVKHKNVTVIQAPVMQVSSSFIRAAVSAGKDVRYLLTEPVFKYLDEMNFYR